MLLVLLVIPSIIYVANQRLLFDDLESYRKDHKYGISRLGGVSIFCSVTITTLVFSRIGEFTMDSYLLTSAIILFAVGLKDDLCGVNPRTKFIMQFIIAGIMVTLSGVRINSLYGVFNIYELPFSLSVILSVVAIMFLVNSFNLIDGIDGLAASTGLLINLVLSLIFIAMGEREMACLSFAMVGASIAFLKYNLTPAKIFLGDTGSLLIGFISVISVIKFVDLNHTPDGGDAVFAGSAPAFAVALLIVPLFDTLRVFVLRLLNNGSPFVGDRNHIHHRLLRLGLSHLQATLLLVSVNLIILAGTFALRGSGNPVLIAGIFLFCLVFNGLLTMLIRLKEGARYRFSGYL